jgi:CheY-like chemotaxis protein
VFNDARDELMTDSAPTPRESHDTPPIVLVVEDEPVIRELMSMLLEDEGYVVHQAVDGQQALEAVEQHRIDLVLSDVKMPRLDGATLAHHLCARVDPIPVVLMSAVYAEVDLPGVRFLRKPIDGEQLLRIIAAALQETGRSARGGTLDEQQSTVPFGG